MNPVSTRSLRPLTPVRQVLSGGHVLRYLRREALYLFAWSTSIRESGWVGFVEAAIFIFVLLAGLVYLVRIGALDWTPARSRRERMNPETDSIANRQR